MDPRTAAALEPVLHDLACAFVAILDAEELPGASPPAIVLRGWEGTLHWFALDPDMSAAEHVVDAADHVQDLVADLLHGTGLPAAWPGCPAHPGAHPLAPRVLEDHAVWECPADRTTAVSIGSMTMQLQRLGFSRSRIDERLTRPDGDQELEPVMAAALAPALHDLRTSGGPGSVVSDDRWGNPDIQATANVWSLDGPAGGITVRRDASEAEQVVEAADGLQEWAVDVLWDAQLPTDWPVCPAHPTTHPLRPELQHGRPVWACPRTGDAVAPIGRLAS